MANEDDSRRSSTPPSMSDELEGSAPLGFGAVSRAWTSIVLVRRSVPMLVLVALLSAAWSLGCKRSFYEGNADIPVSSWVMLKHPSYPISARVPKGWVSEVGRNEIIPVDTWALHPPGPDPAVRVSVSVAWLPRGGRHGAGFPGGLLGDERDTKRPVAGKMRTVTIYSDGAGIRGDFDSAELAISFHGHADSSADGAIVGKVLELLDVDDRVKPPADARPMKRALDLARDYAKKKGWRDDHVAFVCAAEARDTFLLTIFHARDMTAVAVDVAKGSVAESHDSDPTRPKCSQPPTRSPASRSDLNGM